MNLNITNLQLQTNIYSIQADFDTLANAKNYLQVQLNSTLNTTLSQAIQLNEEIATDTIYEENQQLVNEIYLNMLLSDDWVLDSADQQIVSDIASQCALLGGDAVYRARALMALYNQAVFNDDSICSQAMEQYQSSGNSKLNEFQIYIQPNPGSEWITIQCNSQEVKIKNLIFRELSGKPIHTIYFKESQNLIELNISDLNPGILLLELELTNGIILNRKILKI